jgi:protein-tyrosine kinase
MSRIQEILNKAERDGTTRRTRALTEETPLVIARPTPSPAAAPVYPRATHETPPLGPSTGSAPGSPLSRSSMAPHIEEPVVHGNAVAGHLHEQLVAALTPASIAAEQYRSLRTRIKRAENGRAIRTIVITSPAKGDGKSLTASNLALTMAQEFQQRVLLLDADLRRPTVHRLFGLNDTPGLVDVLMGVAELDDAIVTIPDHHLSVLPAGVPPGRPAELLGSTAMRRTLDALAGRYDRILIDMPPVAPLADLHVVAPMADAILMIVRAGMTPKPAIEQALAGLDISKVLGLVLNDSGDHAPDKYKYEGYGYIAG